MRPSLSPILKAGAVSILQGLLISCNQMSAEYLFMTDKLYDVRYDTGDKVIQCGRHNDVFKLWLQWRAKVQNPLYCYRKLPLCFFVTHRLCILSSNIIRSIVLRWFINFYWNEFYYFIIRAQKVSRNTWIGWWSWRSTWLEELNKCPISTIWFLSLNWWTSVSGTCPRACETCHIPRRE